MKRYILTKSQVKKLKLAESKNLLLEGDMSTLISKAQEGDVIYIQRSEEAGDRSFKISEIRNDSIIAQALFGKKSYVQISEASVEDSEGNFVFVNIYTESGKKISGGNTVRIGGVENVYLVRDNSAVETVPVSEPADKRSDDEGGKKKQSKVEERSKEIKDVIENANEGDILTITTGKMNEDGEIDRSTMTNIKFKVTEKPDKSEMIVDFQGADGENESNYTDLKNYDSIRINTWSVKVNPENADKLDVTLTITHGGETANYSISDVVIFDVESGGEESEEDEDVEDELSDEQIKKLKDNPNVEKALRLGMELDDIIQKLKGKKNKKAKGKFRHGAKMTFMWLSETIGEGPYQLEKGRKKDGTYNKEKNRIKSRVRQSQTGGKGSYSIYLEDLQKTDKKDIYKVKVHVQREVGNDIEDVFEEPKEGIIKITSYYRSK